MVNVMTDLSAATGAAGRSPDLRDWLKIADEIGHLRRIEGADWDLEIGAVTELALWHSPNPPCLVFDEIKDYPAGWRVVTLPFASKELAAVLLGLSPDLSRTEMIQAWRARTRGLGLLPTQQVDGGPLFENLARGADIDLWKLPTPRWHEDDGGRYLGTGCIVVTRDPEGGHINVGTYRMQVLDRDKIGLYISPGHHGLMHREKYFKRGEPMPVAAAFGMHPLLLEAGSHTLPINVNEYEWAGAVQGAPVEVVAGPVTGLPVPANAEIVVEGFLHPDRTLEEGPFGEFTGYYASEVRREPYVQVEALYHRNDPIILGSPPTRPQWENTYSRGTMQLAMVWDSLEMAGVPDVRGIGRLSGGGYGMMVVSIRQRYQGHAKQAGLVAAQSRGAVYVGRYVVVVDEDIDPWNSDQVMWALWTRSEPSESLEVLHNCWSTPLDPRISPEKRAKGDFTNSRLIIDATRPYYWRDQFPKVCAASDELLAKVRQKWGNVLFG